MGVLLSLLSLVMKNGFRQIPQFLMEWIIEQTLLDKIQSYIEQKKKKRQEKSGDGPLEYPSLHERC